MRGLSIGTALVDVMNVSMTMALIPGRSRLESRGTPGLLCYLTGGFCDMEECPDLPDLYIRNKDFCSGISGSLLLGRPRTTAMIIDESLWTARAEKIFQQSLYVCEKK